MKDVDARHKAGHDDGHRAESGKMPRNLAGDFDYIVVGAGTAGCIVANRLSADPSKRVLILEAGGKDNWIWFHIPVGYLFAIGNPRSDWMFKTEAEPGLNGRALSYPRGKVIGGCSAINAMISMRGQAADYDHWRQLGLAGWGYADVLPAFRRLEDHFLGESEHHGAGGGWRIEAPRLSWTILDAPRSEEHTSELQSQFHLVCRLLLEKKKTAGIGSTLQRQRLPQRAVETR